MAALTYLPGLDGVRALAVAAVLCFHGGQQWAGGGFLGVDAFFVLSGYLITTLLLVERRRTGRVDVVAFWARRARRLMPAMLMVVATVVLTAPMLVPVTELRLLRADAWATLLYVNNWQSIAGDSDYFAATASPSPLEHTWSLAIEEQFYLVWPAVVMLMLARGRGSRLLLGLCVIGAAASSLALAILHDPLDPGRAYFGTDTRGASLLIGAVLAVVLSRDGLPAAVARSRWLGRTLGMAGSVAGAGVLLAWARADGGHTWLYRGGLTALAVGVALVLAQVVLTPRGVTARVLALPPLPQLGRISYGVYLWHWPIFLAATSERTGLEGTALFLARCSAVILVATASYRLVELPVRSGSWLRRPSLAIPSASACFAACALLVALVTSVPGRIGPGPAQAASLEGASGGGLADLARATRDPPPDASSDPAEKAERHTGNTSPRMHEHRRHPGRPLVVDVFGDSLATSLVVNLPSHARLDIRDRTLVGCGVTLRAPYRYFGHTYPTVWRSCRPWVRLWKAAIDHDDPDVVLILVGRWETMDRVLEGRWTHVGRPDMDAHLRERLGTAISIAGSHGARVVLATQPFNRRGEQADGSIFPEDDPARVRRWNGLLGQVAQARPDVMVLPFGQRVSPGRGFTWTAGGVTMRTDGVHLSSDGVRLRIAPWLFPRLLRMLPVTSERRHGTLEDRGRVLSRALRPGDPEGVRLFGVVSPPSTPAPQAGFTCTSRGRLVLLAKPPRFQAARSGCTRPDASWARTRSR